jgi:hypothetical protein
MYMMDRVVQMILVLVIMGTYVACNEGTIRVNGNGGNGCKCNGNTIICSALISIHCSIIFIHEPDDTNICDCMLYQYEWVVMNYYMKYFRMNSKLNCVRR